MGGESQCFFWGYWCVVGVVGYFLYLSRRYSCSGSLASKPLDDVIKWIFTRHGTQSGISKPCSISLIWHQIHIFGSGGGFLLMVLLARAVAAAPLGRMRSSCGLCKCLGGGGSG